MEEAAVHEALIQVMVMAAAADGGLSDTELLEIRTILQTLPVFAAFDRDRLPAIAEECGRLLTQRDGVDRIIEAVRDNVPERLHETAYALAIEVSASDLAASQPELRFLQMMRDGLALDTLATAAIERSARVRYRRLSA